MLWKSTEPPRLLLICPTWWPSTSKRLNISLRDWCKLKTIMVELKRTSFYPTITKLTWCRRALSLKRYSKRKLIKYNTLALLELQCPSTLITSRIWDTRENSGSEIHLKKCKSFSILDLPSLGCSLRNVRKENALLRTEGITKAYLLLSMRMKKLVKPFSTEREKY